MAVFNYSLSSYCDVQNFAKSYPGNLSYNLFYITAQVSRFPNVVLVQRESKPMWLTGVCGVRLLTNTKYELITCIMHICFTFHQCWVKSFLKQFEIKIKIVG